MKKKKKIDPLTRSSNAIYIELWNVTIKKASLKEKNTQCQ